MNETALYPGLSAAESCERCGVPAVAARASKGSPICVLFENLGPYHRARLNALAQLSPVLAIQLFPESREYAWEPNDERQGFACVTLFANKTLKFRSADMAQRLHKVLSQHRPAVLAIPGWSDKMALAGLSWCQKNRTPAIVMSDSTQADAIRT